MKKRNPKSAKRREQTLQLWSYDAARGAVPYITAIMQSLREHQLEAQRYMLQNKRLADRPGRPDRHGILAQENAVRGARESADRFQEALEELQILDVFCVDAVQGEALIPFAHDKQLAWYVFDLFEDEPLRYWRYHTDPLETRRPVAEILGDNPAIV